jgi:hypothetical protein
MSRKGLMASVRGCKAKVVNPQDEQESLWDEQERTYGEHKRLQEL